MDPRSSDQCLRIVVNTQSWGRRVRVHIGWTLQSCRLQGRGVEKVVYPFLCALLHSTCEGSLLIFADPHACVCVDGSVTQKMTEYSFILEMLKSDLGFATLESK